MIASAEDIPIPTQPASIAGQKDLLSWEPRTDPEPEYFRKCNRCGEHPPVIYDPKVSPSGCPVCRYNEFSLAPAPVAVEEGNEHMSATATAPRKSQEDQTKALKAKGSSAALDFKTNGIDWEEIDIEVASIQPRPGQPRKYFDPDKLNELADNIELLGVLQRVLVQRIDDGYQLIAGERRWRACELRGRKLIPARVVNATEEQIELICLTENLQREGLTVIEEAEAYQRAIDNLKCTQSDLAKKLGLSQGQVSNRIRLLKNPPAIREAIISGEIDASTGRDLATWCDLPAISQELDEWAARQRNYGGLTNSDVVNACYKFARQNSRPVDCQHRVNSSDEGLKIVRTEGLPAKVLKRLDVRNVPSFVGHSGSPRAFNLEAWDELAVEFTWPDEDDEDEGVQPQLSAAEIEQAKQRRAEMLQRNLRNYLNRWYWSIVAVWIPDASSASRWRLMSFFGHCENYGGERGTDEELVEIIEKCGGVPDFSEDDNINLWASSATVTDAETFAALLLRNWAENQAKGYASSDVELQVIEGVVKEFGITVAEHWQCDRKFLELFDQDGLVNLMLEWKRRGPGDSVSEREPLIDWMLEENGRKKFPAPKCLKSLKLTDK